MSHSAKLRAVLFCSAVLACAIGAPKRPTGLPESAQWAGGAEGGAWIDCGMVAKEPTVAYGCTIYRHNGKPWARGRFVLANVSTRRRPHFVPASAPESLLPMHYKSWDGEVVRLSRTGVSLVPDGTIDFPLDRAHGKKLSFALGKHIGPETSY